MTLNLVVIAGLSGLVGMFSEQAIKKLNDVADATFGSTKKEEKKPESGQETTPATPP